MVQNIFSLIKGSEVKKIFQPLPDSHKGENGRVLIIGGSKKYHGAPILAAKIAAKIVDLVYFASSPENNRLIQKMKGELAEFIAINQGEIDKYLKKVDSVVIGPGLGLDPKTKKLVNYLLKKFPEQKFIIDADALKMVDLALLNKNCLLTPHHKEFEILFGIKADFKNVRLMAKKYQCIIVLKGRKDLICSAQECRINQTGNQGLTKGGTGDVLAGLIGALAAKNDLFLVGCVGAFINGLAGDELKKKISYYYNASDLIEEIPIIIKKFL